VHWPFWFRPGALVRTTTLQSVQRHRFRDASLVCYFDQLVADTQDTNRAQDAPAMVQRLVLNLSVLPILHCPNPIVKYLRAVLVTFFCVRPLLDRRKFPRFVA
jgi:hypothetical protein